MNRDAFLCARYWRNAVADTELGRGTFRGKDADAFTQVGSAGLLQGQVGAEIAAAFFKGNHADAESRTVLLRPFVYRARSVHGRRQAFVPDVITPVVSRTVLFPDGRLAVPTGAVTPRDLLEPLDRTAVTIGTLEALDHFLTLFPGPDPAADGADPAAGWQAYRAYCDQLAKAVFPGLAGDRRFEPTGTGFLEATDHAGHSRSIAALYDQILKDRPQAPLFFTFAAQPMTDAEPCLAPEAGFAARLGHSSPHYSLATAQRHALTHLMAARHGEVVAVNGPPGTGKTTLLLSVVASLWAKAALAEGEPPVIFAASTNNQAVTNIIDAFEADFSKGEGPFAGRWLPKVTGFGSYFPARSRKVSEAYLTEEFFNRIEQPGYLDQARPAFLRAAAAAFPDLPPPSVETAVQALHARLRAQADALAGIEAAWGALCAARARSQALPGGDPDAAREKRRAALDEAEQADRRAQDLAALWDRFQAHEPLLQILFGWLPAVARKRLASARAALRPHWPGPLPNWTRVGEITPAVSARAQEAARRVAQHKTSLAEADAARDALRAGRDGWRTALRVLGVDPGAADRMTLADCDPLAERHLRFPLFLTATHYWEGRWLLDMAAIDDLAAEKRRKERDILIRRWRRRMKLTPCAVSTFYVLPEQMCAHGEERRRVPDYLYDSIDLLIVDEAGQAAPEIAGAAFALARRALVIGDTMQIAPIWNIPGPVDVGNLRAAGLLSPEDQAARRNPFAETGRAAASGSVMRVAQHVSRYHQDPDLARGLVLYEHRRCFDEIIGYCNDLCYRGKLKPLRGSKAAAAETDGLPAMGYAQVDGLCEQLSGGSRRNAVEAETIAAWIAHNRAALERSYPGRTLGAILGVVTPFAGQVHAIRMALDAAGIEAGPDGGVTVGSIHAFQGAQRPVMIFSPTYSKHADGDFIDISPSMLNVAVSRAMNSFLVFGDMDCFSTAARTSPRGQLAARLFAAAGNALSFAPAPRRDLMRTGPVEHLRDAAQHDAFLRAVLAGSRREVQVVTPWLTRRALDESGLIAALSAAAARGVALTVYTDPMLNQQRAAQGQAALDDLNRATDLLAKIGAKVVAVRDVHSKIVMADNDLFCAGSFNWFSAVRDGDYARHETSLAYRGQAVAKEIEAMKVSLHKRIVP